MKEDSTVVQYSVVYRILGPTFLAAMTWAGWFGYATGQLHWMFWVLWVCFVVPGFTQVLFFRIATGAGGFEYRNALGITTHFDYREVCKLADGEFGGYWIYMNRIGATRLDRLLSVSRVGRMLAVLSLAPHPIHVPPKLRNSERFRELVLSQMVGPRRGGAE